VHRRTSHSSLAQPPARRVLKRLLVSEGASALHAKLNAEPCCSRH